MPGVHLCRSGRRVCLHHTDMSRQARALHSFMFLRRSTHHLAAAAVPRAEQEQPQRLARTNAGLHNNKKVKTVASKAHLLAYDILLL